MNWLERIYLSCKRNSPIERSSRESSGVILSDSVGIDGFIETHQGLLWFWALWECAQFCVHGKLKTPLGKAPETFIAFESIIYKKNTQKL